MQNADRGAADAEVSREEFERFADENAPRQGSPMQSPPFLVLKGDTGQFHVERRSDEGRWIKTKVPKASLPCVIVARRFLVEWPYDAAATKKIRSREFNGFHEPIVLLITDQANRDKETNTVEERYADYAALKKANSSVDRLTGKAKVAYDLKVSLYVLLPEHDELVAGPTGEEQVITVPSGVYCLRLKGASRNAFMDGNIMPIRSVVMVGSREEEMEKIDKATGKKMSYQVATFNTVGDVPPAKYAAVMAAAKLVRDWMGYYESLRSGRTLPGADVRAGLPPRREQEPAPEVTPVAPAVQHDDQDWPSDEFLAPAGPQAAKQEIRLEDIPF